LPPEHAGGPGRAALAGLLGALLILGGEEMHWRFQGQPADLSALLGASALVAVMAAVVAGLLGRWLPVAVAAILALLPVAAQSLAQAIPRQGWWWGAALSPLLAGPVGWLARRRLGLAGLAVAAATVWGVAAHRPMSWVAPAGDGPDILLVVLDTTRRDRLSLYGYPRPTSPALDAFARDAEVYEDAWSVAPWTPPSHASLLSGLLPGEHGVDGAHAAPLPADLLTLPAVLRHAGYVNGGFVANPNLLAPGWGSSFHQYLGPRRAGGHSLIRRFNERIGQDVLLIESTPLVLAHARRFWAAHADRPRFVFVNLIDPHNPYLPPPDLLREAAPELTRDQALSLSLDPLEYHLDPGMDPRRRSQISRLYDGEVQAMDRELGRFLAWLEERQELDRTLVVITADHGERLGERGVIGHDLDLDPYLLRVPLVIRYPPAVAPGRIGRRVQLDGLPGYILDLAGVPAPEAMRRSALQNQNRELVVAQRQDPAYFLQRLRQRRPDLDVSSWRGDWYFVAGRRFAHVCRSGPPSPRCQLNDMDEDPDWERDQSETHPQELERLAAAGAGLPRFGKPRPAQMTAELREALRALGYVD
jgi:arylsulfatase A-like enzyme